jgi:TP901-1 family phage major tail protein
MTAYRGRNLTLKFGAGGSAPIITQARSHTLTVNNEIVDITNKDSNGYRTLLEDAGVRSASISIEGIVDNTTAFESFKAAAMIGTIGTYRLEFADGDVFEGLFQPTSFAVSGSHNNEQTFTASLESSGAWTFTAA